MAAWFRATCVSLLLVGGLAAAPGALAQSDTQFLMERINRLENDLRGLQRQVYRGGPVPPSAAAPSLGGQGDEAETSIANRLSGRIDQLESQLRDLVGRLEEVEFKNTQTQRRVEKMSEDVDYRLNQIERAAPVGAAPGAVQPAPAPAASGPAAPAAGEGQQVVRGSTSSQPANAPTKEGILGTLPADSSGRPLPPQATTAPAARAGQAAAPAVPAPPAASAKGKLPAGSPKERYDYAYKLLVQSEFADAEAAFREFVAAHGADPLAGNAQYWLGETYYVRQQFEPASAAFLKGYQGYPKGAKAPDSLLKLGMSLTAMKKTAEACAAFNQLGKEFPNAPPHVKDAAGRERGKAGCR